MNGVIWTQIIAQLMLTFVFGGIVIAGVVTKEVALIIASVVSILLWILFFLNMIRVIKEELGHKDTSKVNYTYFICLIIGSVFFGGSLYANIESIEFRKNAKETTGIIYDIEKSVEYKTEYDEDGNSYEKKEETCLNYVQYEVDGKTYKDKLSLVSCNYDIGDEVGIYYDVDNPAIMEEKNNKYFLLFAFVLSTIFMSVIVVVGLKEMFSTVKSMKKILKKKKNKKVTRKK